MSAMSLRRGRRQVVKFCIDVQAQAAGKPGRASCQTFSLPEGTQLQNSVIKSRAPLAQVAMQAGYGVAPFMPPPAPNFFNLPRPGALPVAYPSMDPMQAGTRVPAPGAEPEANKRRAPEADEPGAEKRARQGEPGGYAPGAPPFGAPGPGPYGYGAPLAGMPYGAGGPPGRPAGGAPRYSMNGWRPPMGFGGGPPMGAPRPFMGAPGGAGQPPFAAQPPIAAPQ